MEDTRSVRASSPAPLTEKRSSPWRVALKIGLITILVLIAVAAGAAYRIMRTWSGGTGNGIFGINTKPLIDPRSQFPGQDRMTVLCLGLDRNIFTNHRDKKDPRNGMAYTKGARSDVMMIASLDLKTQKVSILSIPRDTRIQLPGKRRFSKINQAHADGGVPYTRETVEQFLGIKIDHYVVIKQEAIQKVVDELGGLDVEVKHDMDYDDSWGQLHIHLKEGQQHLRGEDVVGFMRFRHDAEGDFGRIKRQQQVIQQLSGKVKSPLVITKADGLIRAIRQYVNTDLTPDQQLALAVLFHKMDPEHVVTTQLPVLDTETINNVSYVIPDDSKKEAVVDWVINGNEEAMNRMIRVELKNASGDPELYQRVYRLLRHNGFMVWRAGRATGQLPTSRVVQRTSLRGSARRVLDVLGLKGNVEKSEDSGADVTLYVGKDLEGNPGISFADNYEDLPDSPRFASSRPHSKKPRRSQYEAVDVKVHTVEPEAEPKAEADPMTIPGAAEPAPAAAGESPDSGAEKPAGEKPAPEKPSTQ